MRRRWWKIEEREIAVVSGESFVSGKYWIEAAGKGRGERRERGGIEERQRTRPSSNERDARGQNLPVRHEIRMVLLRAVEAREEVDAGARRRRGAVVRIVRGRTARPLLVGRLARTLVHALLPEARQRRGAARQPEAREQHLDGVLVEDQV